MPENKNNAHGGPIGSDAWVGADVYEIDSKYNERTAQFVSQVKWDVLAGIASRHRNRVACTYDAKFSVGQFNLVRRLRFTDGVSWVVRVRLPSGASPAPLDEYDSRRAFEIEVASMIFFK